MTIALAIKVNDGVVLTADSATTFFGFEEGRDRLDTTNVYNNGEKITNIHKELALGIMTWGLASIGGHSINWHGKELRERFEGGYPDYISWKLGEDSYELSEVSDKVFDYFSSTLTTENTSPPYDFGLLIGGYSANSNSPEIFTIQTKNSVLQSPEVAFGKGDSGIIWFGQPETLVRLVKGISLKLPSALANLGVEDNLISSYVSAITAQVNTPLVQPGMAIHDAIELAYFLVETTIKYIRFISGPNTVAGPIDLAAITKHEKFKWVERKHYYPLHLNQRG